MQADALLLECRAFVLRRRRADATAVRPPMQQIRRFGIDDRLQSEERQQPRIEIAGALVVRSGEENMPDAVEFHGLPLRGSLW